MPAQRRPELVAALTALAVFAVVAVPVGLFLLLSPHNQNAQSAGTATTPPSAPGTATAPPVPQIITPPVVGLVPIQEPLKGGPAPAPLDKLDEPLIGVGLKFVVPDTSVKVTGDGVRAFGDVGSRYGYQFAASWMMASLTHANAMFYPAQLDWLDFALFAENMDAPGRARLQDLTASTALVRQNYPTLVTTGPFYWSDGSRPVPSTRIPPVQVTSYGTAIITVGPAVAGVATMRVVLPVTATYNYLDGQGRAWSYQVTKTVPLLLVVPDKKASIAFRLHAWETGTTQVGAPVRTPALDQTGS